MGSLESSITKSIINELNKRGAYCIKKYGNNYGSTGVPDILVCYRGGFYGIEVKQPGKKATPLQEHNI